MSDNTPSLHDMYLIATHQLMMSRLIQSSKVVSDLLLDKVIEEGRSRVSDSVNDQYYKVLGKMIDEVTTGKSSDHNTLRSLKELRSILLVSPDSLNKTLVNLLNNKYSKSSKGGKLK